MPMRTLPRFHTLMPSCVCSPLTPLFSGASRYCEVRTKLTAEVRFPMDKIAGADNPGDAGAIGRVAGTVFCPEA